MNYAGKFDATLSADGSGPDSRGHGHFETITQHATHAPAGAIIVPDSQLLFNGDFKRSGVDLVLSHDHHELVLHDYFKGEKRAALSSPDGAHLTGDLVNALTGHTEYAQAGGATAAAQVIGHVTKLMGTATAVRNGVSIILNNGDNVEKGDVVQSGSDSTLGITFIDGTVFGLSSNARMVLNEMVYDPNGSNNSSLISLVAGTISFVAGETAKHGDMKVDTPVATMGIRGTAVLVEIDFNVPGQGGAPDAKFQVLVEPDGTTGSYILFDKNTLTPIATVNQAGQQINISQGQVSITNAPLPPDIQKLITDVFSLKFTDNSNPKTFDHFTDIGIPQSLQPIFLQPNGPSATPVIVNVNFADNTTQQNTNAPTNSNPHIPGPPKAVILGAGGQPTTAFHATELAGKTHDVADADSVSLRVNWVDVNAGDVPSALVKFGGFTYQNAANGDVTGALNGQQLADIAAIELKLVAVPDAGNTNIGSASIAYSLPDGAFDFLGAGETVTLHYWVEVHNNFAPSDEVALLPFTITITGTNDVPVITSSAPTIAFSGGTSVPGGSLTTNVPTTGTLAFDDVDLTDTHTVSTPTLTGAVGVLNGVTLFDGVDKLPPGPLGLLKAALSASIANDSTGTGTGTIHWTLADLPVYVADFLSKGEVLTLTYTVTLTDSQGAAITKDVIVTITGTDEPAVVWIDTNPVPESGALWSDPSNWATGTVPTANDDAIVITDQLHGLTPTFPVTINAPAVAKSLTMNDFGTRPPEVDNQSTLTIGGALGLSADSIVKNFGTISVGGLAEILNQSVLQNSGLITLAQGGDFKTSVAIANSGTIEVGGGTLNVLTDIIQSADEASGYLTVDGTARLTLTGVSIDGGTVTNSGEIDLTGAAVLKNGSLGNSGTIDVSGLGNALHNEDVTANNRIEILPGGALTIDQGSTVTHTGMIRIDDGAAGIGELTLDNATIDGGSVLNSGAIEFTGFGVLENGSLSNSNFALVSGLGNALHHETVEIGGALQIVSGGALAVDKGTTVLDPFSWEVVDGTLTLSDATINSGVVFNDAGGTIDLTGSAVIKNGSLFNFGQINVSGAGNAFHDQTITNGDALEILADGVLTVDQLTQIGNANGIMTVDGAATLMLNGATINGGSLGNSGQINVSGAGNALDGVTVTANYMLEIFSGGALLFDQGTAVTNAGGTIAVDASAKLTLDTATIAGGTLSISGTLDATGNGTLTDVGITNHGLVEATGGVLTIDPAALVTLTNFGTLEANGGELDITGEPVINTGTLQAIASSTLKLTSMTVTNTGGTMTVGGGSTLDLSAAIINGGSLGNSGQIDVGGTGNALDKVTVTANHALEILAAGLLLLDQGTTVANAGGTITVDGTATLMLNHATIDGGTINNYSTVSGSVVAGHIDVTGDSTISGASLNYGDVKIERGISLTLDNVAVTGTSIEVDSPVRSAPGDLILENGTTITDSQLTIDGNDLLTLKGATIDGGIITDNGIIDAISGSSTIGAGTTVHNHGTIEATGGTLTIHGAIVNDGALKAEGGTLVIDGDVTGTGTAIIGNGGTLDLGGADAQTITFDGLGTLKLEASSNFTGTISGLASIDLAGTIVTSAYFNGSTLLVNGKPVTFDVSVPAGDAVAFKSDGSGGTILKVLPQVLSVGAPAPAAGVEGAAIHLAFSDTVTGANLASFVIGGIPDGAVITDGTPGHTYTSGSADGSVDVAAWNLSNLTITPADAANFTLKALVTAVDGDGYDYSLPETEIVVVSPTAPTVAPVAKSGLEGTAIALDLGTTVNDLPGDTNSLASLIVSTIPVGATLSDGHGHSFTAAAGSTSVDVHDWTLSSLAIKPAGATSFTLHVAATEHDAEGNLSPMATGTEAVTVTPDMPIIVRETDPAEQAVIVVTPGQPIVLAPGSSNNTLGLNTETFNGQSEGSHSNNGAGHGNFYSTALNATFSASGHAGVVDDSSSVTSAPFIGPLPGGVDTTNYLSIGGGATETITFAAEENAFGLYWGSVDSYNTIAFYHGGSLVASYAGADVAPLLANGGQGSFASNGYVEFYGLPSFDKVVLGSTSNAFEIDNISAGSIPGAHAELAAPITGTLFVSDVAVGDTLTASVLGNAVATYNGSTTLPGNVNLAGLINAGDVTFDTTTSDGGTDVLHWTYNANNPDLDFLKSGDTLTLTFTAQVNNGLHGSTDQPLTVTIAGTNSSADLSQFKFVSGTSQNDTFGDVHGNVTIFGAGGQDTFVFKPNFGNPTIADFNVNNDAINISHTLFTSVSAILASAQSANSGHDTVITDSHHDTITLLGVTVAQLQQHPSDFHLV